MTKESESAHILSLSSELLDDIELDRLSSDKLVLKASRLARLAGSDEIRTWLSFEMQGYIIADPIAKKYISLTGRWTSYEKEQGYFGPLGQQEHLIEALKANLQASQITSVEGDWAFRVSSDARQNRSVLTSQISQISGIRSRVMGLLHSFVSGVYYERQFADAAESTFDTYKKTVDALLADKAGDVLTKFPSVIARLNDGDIEAVSQALTTCRRILEAFADAVLPPSDDVYEIDGNKISLGANNHKNRINAYIASRTESKSRRTRLRQNIGNLFDRVSTGVHDNVSRAEAFSLFLNVYLLLGEILSLDGDQ